MRWYWEYLALPQGDRRPHLDRVFGYPNPRATLPDDFGVRSDRTEHRCAHCPQQGSDQRVDSSKSRAGIADRGRAAKSRTAFQPSGRGHLLVGFILFVIKSRAPSVLTLPDRFDNFAFGCAATISDGEPVAFRDRRSRTMTARESPDFRRFALALAAFTVLPPLLIGAFIIAVDPAYVFGSPSWPHVNAVRPYYEGRVLVAKPYQVWRRRPSAVALGSSRVEVGIDPRHPGWIDTNAFNFAMPSSNSYAVMLAFLHAQRVGAPLKQAVVGLDFFGYNINFDLGAEILEARFADGISSEFAQFLDERLASDAKPSTPAAPAIAIPPRTRRGTKRSISRSIRTLRRRLRARSSRPVASTTIGSDGRSVATAARCRQTGTRSDIGRSIPMWLRQSQAAGFSADIINISWPGAARGGSAGFSPRIGTKSVISPPIRTRAIGWPRAPTGPAICTMSRIGLSQGLAGGLPPRGLADWLRLRWPTLSGPMFKLREGFSLVLSRSSARDAVGTVLRQSQAAAFDDLGVRVWHGHDEELRRLGGFAALFRGMLAAGSWYPTLAPPTLVYCFANPRHRREHLRLVPLHATASLRAGDGSAALCDAAARRHAGTLWSRSVSASATSSGCGSSSASTSRRQPAPDANRCRFGTSATPTPSPANRFLPRATLPRCGGSGSIRTTARPPAI